MKNPKKKEAEKQTKKTDDEGRFPSYAEIEVEKFRDKNN